MSYQKDFAWQRKFLPEIKRLCADQFITEAPVTEDLHHNTDLMVLLAREVRIACRLRRAQYVYRYGEQITIRTGRHYGKTELAKIMEGWGEYLFYGFANINETALMRWTLIDLRAFRTWFIGALEGNAGKRPGIPRANPDGSSCFHAFETRLFSPGVVIATSPAVCAQASLFAQRGA